MKAYPLRVLGIALLVVAIAGPVRAAEPLALRPRFEPGDVYVLSLRTTTRTDASSRSPRQDSFREAVELDYTATVVVLEVDGDGHPLRERHEDVSLSVDRDEGAGSLFGPQASFEVQRRPDGGIRLFVHGERDRRLEKTVGAVLASQLEFSPLAALLDPGRPVSVGDSWPLDRERVHRYLRSQGLRVIDFGEPPTATLSRAGDGDDELIVHYAIPIDWSELRHMPPNTRTARSTARLEGRVRLPASAHPSAIAHASSLVVSLNGAVRTPGVATSFPWSLDRTCHSDQRTLRLEKTVVSGL